jgi:hypothetical protein
MNNDPVVPLNVAMTAIKGFTRINSLGLRGLAEQGLTEWMLTYPDFPWKIAIEGLIVSDSRYKWALPVLISNDRLNDGNVA